MNPPTPMKLAYDDYGVAIICPLEVEMSAMRYMLDEEHVSLPSKDGDSNCYIYGRMSGHNVVIGYLPHGSQGIGAAAAVATNIKRSFPNAILRLLVGIGGGVPSPSNDIRLGDVVVSMPMGTYGGVVQYDLGKETVNGFERKGFLEPPPLVWRTRMVKVQSDHLVQDNQIVTCLKAMVKKYPRLTKYLRPAGQVDVLFLPHVKHVDGETTCQKCNPSAIVNRPHRVNDNPAIFYGLVASGNRVVKDPMVRDRIAKDAGGALCVEMEAAGLMNDFPCIVIRGISDYADSHKNDNWHAYSAAVAAGCAKELLTYMEPMDCQSEAASHFSHAIPFRRDGNSTELDILNDLWDPFIEEDIPLGTAFKFEYDVGVFAETQISFSEGVTVNTASKQCMGRACKQMHGNDVFDCPVKAIYVCEECPKTIYCKRCALENAADPNDYHKVNHRLRHWRPARRFEIPPNIVKLDPNTIAGNPEGVERALKEFKSLKVKQKRSSVVRLFVPTPKLDPDLQNCTKIELDFCLDHIPTKTSGYWILDKFFDSSVKRLDKAGEIKIYVKRMSLPTAPWDVFHPSNGYSEQRTIIVKPKKQNQPHRIEMRIPPAIDSNTSSSAIEIAINYVQDFTVILDNGEPLGAYQYKLRFNFVTMSTKDKAVQFGSRGEILQVESLERDSELLAGYDVVQSDDWDQSAQDHQALGKKGYLVRDLVNDIRWLWGKDPIKEDD